MVGEVIYENYAYYGQTLYTDVRLITKHQKRVLGTSWWETDANLRLQWDIRILNLSNLPGYMDSGNITTVADGWLQRSYPSSCDNVPGAGTLCQTLYDNIWTEHMVGCNDGVAR